MIAMFGSARITATACLWLWLIAHAARLPGKSKPFPSLLDATLDDLINGLEMGQFTSTDLVKTYLARIDEVNGTLHAITEINPDALDIAASLDEQRERGRIRGPLHGIPILVKNLIATDDKMNNTAGSWGLVGATVPRDSTIARKLREAGAIILGKTNLSEWANIRSSFTSSSSNGWSAYGGQTYSAYYPGLDPSGSSSGSAVAADLGLAFATLGTETAGSIMLPSERNNIVGIKPTMGLTSRSLVIPVSEHQDSVGPLARTVKDAAYVLQAIAGKDKHDSYTSAIPSIPDFVAACDKNSIRGARIGVPWNVIELGVPGDGIETKAFQKAIKILQCAGATIVEANFTRAIERLQSDASSIATSVDLLTNIASYLAELISNPSDIHSLANIRDWTRASPLEGYPERDTGQWDAILDQLHYNNTDPRFWAAYQKAVKLDGPGGILGALETHNLTAVILPTSVSSPWDAIVGTPMITVPMSYYPPATPVTTGRGGLVNTAPGVPFGLAFLGRQWSEVDLIGLAYAFEQRTRVRGQVKQYLVPTTEVADFVTN